MRVAVCEGGCVCLNAFRIISAVKILHCINALLLLHRNDTSGRC